MCERRKQADKYRLEKSSFTTRSKYALLTNNSVYALRTLPQRSVKLLQDSLAIRGDYMPDKS